MLEWQAVMSPEVWAHSTFGEVRLGDARRTERAVKLATAIAREPQVSLPKQLGARKEVQATYRFLQSAQVSYEALMRPHVQQTRAQYQERSVVLLVQDTTELDYQAHPKTSGLGPIGNGTHQGLLLQTVLALEPSAGEVLGIAHQEPFLRQPAPEGERKSQRVQRERESQVWERAVQAIGAPPDPEQQVWVHVGDRYSDIYTLFVACRQQQTHFVIRAAQDRCVDERVEEVAPALKRRRRKAGDPPQAHLFETVRGWQACDEQELEVPAEHARKARTARVAMSYGPLRLLAPDKREHELPSMLVWVVRVWELDPPEGVEPLEWVLLTSVAVENAEQAWERVGWYRRRWIVEDDHQALKTGCRMEERQIASYEGLRRLLGVLAPTAVRLLQLRTLARQQPERLAEEVMPTEVVQLVALKTSSAAAGMTVEQCLGRIAQLGGYQGRRSDGPPGWKTLWHGWLKIQTLLEGVHLAHQLLLE
jgi:Transposase DNA-binding/Transposase Tn5 dimerisation domain